MSARGPVAVPYVYLHGFASSPQATKAAFFQERLTPYGVTLQRPDLNVPSFSELTLSAQLARVEVEAPAQPAVFLGSSMGALVALLFAQRHPERIARLLLIAPALGFVGHRLAQATGSNFERWRSEGSIPVAHPADGRLHRVGFQLAEDADRYDFDSLKAPAPTMILHGSHDELIPVTASEAWQQRRPETTLHVIDGGDHGLVDHTECLWTLSRDFLLAPLEA